MYKLLSFIEADWHKNEYNNPNSLIKCEFITVAQ